MKKLTIMFACVAMSLSLGVAGCKKKKDEAKPAETPAAKPTDDKAAAPADKPADKPADPAAAPAAGGGDLPASCGEYKAMIEKLASCDKMPQQARDALKQSYDTMSASWANAATLPPEAKDGMDKSCKAGADALKQAAAATCGW
jgi:hypothetical protein